MKKKSLIIIICAIIVFVVSNASTYAFFTDIEEVENTFVVGNIKITLDEANVNDLGERYTINKNSQNRYHAKGRRSPRSRPLRRSRVHRPCGA